MPGWLLGGMIRRVASPYAQDGFRVGFDWGPVGAEVVTGDVVAVVDVLSFTTAVTVAVDLGIEVYPYRWRDETAVAYAKQYDAALTYLKCAQEIAADDAGVKAQLAAVEKAKTDADATAAALVKKQEVEKQTAARRAAEEQARRAAVQKQVDDAKAAVDAGNLDAAAQALAAAATKAPNDPAVLAAQRELQRARDCNQRNRRRVLEAIGSDRMRRVQRDGVRHRCRHFIAASRTCSGRIQLRQRKSPGSHTR